MVGPEKPAWLYAIEQETPSSNELRIDARSAGRVRFRTDPWKWDGENLASQARDDMKHDYRLLEIGQRFVGALPRVFRSFLGHRATEEALFNEKERAVATLDSIGDALISTDLSGRVTYVNAAAERMTGWRPEEAAGQPFEHVFRIIDGVSRRSCPNPMDLAVRLNETVGLTSNCVLIRRDGVECPVEDSAAPIHDRQGQVTGAVLVFRDVSAARAVSLQLSHRAAHDSLTDLPNRLLLNDRLSQAIASAQRQRHRLAVLFLDLDRFKQINDTLGHEIGDGLLQSVARRLVESVRRSDTVSRQGGDEFVLLLSRVDEAEDAAASVQKVIKALAAPLDVDGHRLHVTASIGLSMYPEDGQDADTLIRNADVAMYRAKERGRNVYQFYTPDMNVRVYSTVSEIRVSVVS